MDQLFVKVAIVLIRRDSLIVEYFIVTRDSDDALLKLGGAKAKLATGEKISIAGESISALRLNVEGNELPNDTSPYQILCKSYQSLKRACNAGTNVPLLTIDHNAHNFVLIVAVGTGKSLFALSILVIIVAILYKRKTKQWKTSKELIYRSDSISNQTNLNIVTKWHTSDSMKQSNHGFNPSDMLGYSLHPYNQKHYPGNEEGNTENNLAGSSCGYEVISSASMKEFKIKRPHVYGVGNVSYDNPIYN